MLCWPRIIPFIFLIIYFLYKVSDYIIKRNALKKYNRLLDGDDRWDDDYIKLNKWLMKKISEENEKKTEDSKNDNEFFLSSSSFSPSLCREMALLVPENQRSDKNICQEMSRDVCGIDSQLMEKIVIPIDEKTNFISANGMHLLPGETYCVFKKPPLNSKVKCNENWGYWNYSPIQDRWVCRSKVPGIYNAEKDEFSPCKGGGKFVIDNIVVSPKELANEYKPQQFYDVEFQKKCGCICDNYKGYIFVPEISRTTCFKDPCRASLPPFSAAPGYKHKTGECHCGDFFTNLFNDKKQPCTACPYDRPQYDEKNHTLTVHIKCGNQADDLFPCESYEENIRGCRKAIILVKPLSDKVDNEIFEKRIFW